MKTNISNEDAKFYLNDVGHSQVRSHCRSLLGRKKIYIETLTYQKLLTLLIYC